MPRSMTKKPKATPRARRIGSVVNEYSNYLAILVADGPVAAEYRGPSDDDAKSKRAKPDDFDRACKAVNKKEFSIGKKKGVVVEIGGCGVADVYRSRRRGEPTSSRSTSSRSRRQGPRSSPISRSRRTAGRSG